MPKVTDYPRASLKNALSLAEAVNSLGGQCSTDMSAEKLGKQATSGAFKSLVGGTVKYGLITSSKGQLSVTQLFRDIELAYSEEDAQKERQKAFLSPPLFSAIYNRFENKQLPISHFEKLLIKEFDVPDNVASKVSFYFKEGAKQTGLLNDSDVLSNISNSQEQSSDEADSEAISEAEYDRPSTDSSFIEPQLTQNSTDLISSADHDFFSVRIKGPDIDSLITIKEEDLYIVKAMLKKVEKRIASDDEEWAD